MKKYHSLLIIVLALTLNSCGLIFNSIQEKVFFNSEPQGMAVLINDSLYGSTPLIASLSQKENHDVKYRYLDSIVYSDSLRSTFYIKYCLYDLIFPPAILVDALDKTSNELDKNTVYYKSDKHKTTSENLIDSSKNVSVLFKDEKAKRLQAIRLETNYWSIFLLNGEIHKNCKIIGFDEKYLIGKIGEINDYDPDDFTKLITKETLVLFDIDSIDKLLYSRIPKSEEKILKPFLGIAIGAGVGYAGASFVSGNEGEILQTLISVTGGLIGGIIGILSNSSKKYYYYLYNLDREQKVDMLKQLLLMR